MQTAGSTTPWNLVVWLDPHLMLPAVSGRFSAAHRDPCPDGVRSAQGRPCGTEQLPSSQVGRPPGLLLGRRSAVVHHHPLCFHDARPAPARLHGRRISSLVAHISPSLPAEQQSSHAHFGGVSSWRVEFNVLRKPAPANLAASTALHFPHGPIVCAIRLL